MKMTGIKLQGKEERMTRGGRKEMSDEAKGREEERGDVGLKGEKLRKEERRQ